MLLSACAPLLAGGIRIGDTPARRIAKDPAIPGKFVEGQCLPFAAALQAKFQAAGIPSKILSFQYETLSAPRDLIGDQRPVPSINDRGGQVGTHAVVVYEDDGRTYVMDNQSWQPKWIHDASLAGMASQFAGMNIAVGDTRVIDKCHREKIQGPRTPLALPSTASR